MNPLLVSTWARSALELVATALAGLLISAPIGAIALDRTPYATDAPAASGPLTQAPPEAPVLHPLDAKVASERRELANDHDHGAGGARAEDADDDAREDPLSLARATQLP